MMPASFAGKKQLSNHIWQFDFLRPSNYSYQAGQYADFSLLKLAQQTDWSNHAGKNKHQETSWTRTFSLVSRPQQKYLSFAVKIPTPCSDYKHLLAGLVPSQEVLVAPAMGDLVLPRDTKRPLAFIAGGLGIASFVAMLKHLATASIRRPARTDVIYAHKSNQAIYQEVFSDNSAARLQRVISPQHVNIDQLRDSVAALTDPAGLVYVSGSEQFVQNINHQLLAAGVGTNRIVFDYFSGYSSQDLL